MAPQSALNSPMHASPCDRVSITAPEGLIPNGALAAVYSGLALELLTPNLELAVGILQVGSTPCQRQAHGQFILGKV